MKARVPKNFGGVPGNMQGMIQQAQKMQEEITKKQAEIDEMEFTSSVGRRCGRGDHHRQEGSEGRYHQARDR